MKNLVVVFLFLFASLTLLTFFVGVSKTNPKPALRLSSPHVYDNPNASIEEIHLTIFYFVPKDKVNDEQKDWRSVVEGHLKKLQDFHTIQFSGKSKIAYDFFPETIVGNGTSSLYEIPLRVNDDPDALMPVKKELDARVFTQGGDLYAKRPKQLSAHSREVYMIIFEGDGGSGNGSYSLISRAYLTDSAYNNYSTTFLAHEFYHTLGLPDHYQQSAYVYSDSQQTTVSLLTKKDIMGLVDIPITYSYIDSEDLKKMGM